MSSLLLSGRRHGFRVVFHDHVPARPGRWARAAQEVLDRARVVAVPDNFAVRWGARGVRRDVEQLRVLLWPRRTGIQQRLHAPAQRGRAGPLAITQLPAQSPVVQVDRRPHDVGEVVTDYAVPAAAAEQQSLCSAVNRGAFDQPATHLVIQVSGRQGGSQAS